MASKTAFRATAKKGDRTEVFCTAKTWELGNDVEYRKCTEVVMVMGKRKY